MAIKCIQQLKLELKDDIFVNRRVLQDTEVLVVVVGRTYLTGHARHVSQAERAVLAPVGHRVLVVEGTAIWLAQCVEIEE